MLCATCGQPLSPPPMDMEAGAAPAVALSSSSSPLPLRCCGCARVVCHVCQTVETDAPEPGMMLARVSMVCTSCGDRLELQGHQVARPQEEEQAAPVTHERRRELRRAYKEQQRARRREVPPGLQHLLDQGSTPSAPLSPSAPDDSTVVGACAGVVVFFFCALVGWTSRGLDGSYLGMLVGAVVGGVLGTGVAWVINMIVFAILRLVGWRRD